MINISSPPGDTLLETLQVLGMSQVEFARRTGRPVKTINEIIKGKTAITPDTSVQFERVLGIPASFWNNRERQYRESLARQKAESELQDYIDWMEKFPISEMIAKNWIRFHDVDVEQVNELLNFFGIASPNQLESLWLKSYPALKESPAYKKNPYSELSWLRMGEKIAVNTQCTPYHEMSFKELVDNISEMFQLSPNELYGELRKRCAQAGIAICIVPSLENNRIMSVTRWLSPDKVLLQISTQHTTRGSFWNTVLHGFGHILLHGKRSVFIEEKNIKCNKANEVNKFTKQEEFDSLIENLEWPEDRFPDWEIPDSGESKKGDDELSMETLERIEDQSPSLVFWPGFSSAVRQALSAAGLMTEGGYADEELFSSWFEREFDKIDSAILNGYIRDAINDLENLESILKINEEKSPALRAMTRVIESILSRVSSTYEKSRVEIKTKYRAKDRGIDYAGSEYSDLIESQKTNISEPFYIIPNIDKQ